MIHIVSEGISKWLEKEGHIPGESHTLFAYATYSLLFGMIPILIISVLGIAFDMLQEGMMMIFPFMAIRKFSGGFHMKSSGHCIFFSTILLLTALGIIRVIRSTNQHAFLTLLVFFSVLSICIFSPLDNETRSLSPKEKKVFRIIASIISIIAMLIYLILQDARLVSLSIPIGVGILITALLQLPCIISQMLLGYSHNDPTCKE